MMRPEKIVRVARSRGLDGIAITDHGTIRGALETASYASEDFLVIIGAEFALKEGEIIGLFLKEELRSETILCAIDEIHAQGGIAVLPHPFKRNHEWDLDIIERIDAIEVFNARGEPKQLSSKNSLANSLAKRYKKSFTGGSDAHFYFEIGRGFTQLNDDLYLNEIKLAIVEGHTTVGGTLSSPFVEMGSQYVKAYKQMSPRIFLKTFIKSVFLLFQDNLKIK
jgi:predicted metal-dependent phosphoesterase TrpH